MYDLEVTLAALSAGICENVLMNGSSRIVRNADKLPKQASGNCNT
ncbi:hypothetical protein PCH70_37250 [Pseudomonas cichorii JBC1]|nr:hypothetical protein PCH70_37250 [Pseudomonas cichorii JBC1]